MPEDIPVLCGLARELLERNENEPVVCDLGDLVDPDVMTVEALARLQLTALRLGGRVRLLGCCPELRELVAFMGLGDVLR